MRNGLRHAAPRTQGFERRVQSAEPKAQTPSDMSAQILTIDLGNSRCKLCIFERDAVHVLRPIREATFATGSALAREVTAFARLHADVAAVAFSSVGPIALEAEVAAALSAQFGARFEHNPDPRLDNECIPPAGTGRDRLYAARAAIDLSPSGAIVVDAGTALTVDAVVPANHAHARSAQHARSTRPRFLGGAIAPGPEILANALSNHTARLPLVAPRTGAHALGRDTESALQAGIVVGFRGAAAELARQVAREAGLVDAMIVVTGGARAFLLQPTACFAGSVREEGLLVHLGLASCAGSRR